MNSSSSLKNLFEQSLNQLVLERIPNRLPGLREMVSYHFGWNDPANRFGKRLRPMLMLTTSQLFSDNAIALMPAAVAMEVLHNYTLVHDDIEDQGQTRHGRDCLWRKYGLAQALNTGDFLSTLALDIFYDVAKTVSLEQFSLAYAAFREAALGVLRGQYMDIHFETEKFVSLDQYLEMIRLKTACLISASIQIGGILAGADDETKLLLQDIGEHAGLAFQIQDDYLGIWGNSASTGKSNLTDLTTRKKTYPVLLGLAECPPWEGNSEVTDEIASQMAVLLSEGGIHEKTGEAVLDHVRAIKDCQERLAHLTNSSSMEFWNLLESAFSPTYAFSSMPKTRI